MKRRAFLTLALGVLGTRLSQASECSPNECFYDDFHTHGYADNLKTLYERARSGALRKVTTGASIKSELAEAFNSDRLHAVANDTIRTEPHRFQNAQTVRCELDCGVPIIGLLATPENAIGLISVSHGSATTPHRLFSKRAPDYMSSIGASLYEAGFAVWAPFVQHGGNMPSNQNISAMLATYGISTINVLCSSLAAGNDIAKSILGTPFTAQARFGMSGGFYTVMQLAAALDDCPIVAAGEPTDDRIQLRSKPIEERMGSNLPPPMWMLPQFLPLFFPEVGRHINKSDVFFEVALHKSETRSHYEELLDRFDRLRGKPSYRHFHLGGHIVDGGKAITWLRRRMDETRR